LIEQSVDCVSGGTAETTSAADTEATAIANETSVSREPTDGVGDSTTASRPNNNTNVTLTTTSSNLTTTDGRLSNYILLTCKIWPIVTSKTLCNIVTAVNSYTFRELTALALHLAQQTTAYDSGLFKEL